jgi:hypothetical protein
MNSKNIRHLYTGTKELKRGCQPRSNFVKDENGDRFPQNFEQMKEKLFLVMECA